MIIITIGGVSATESSLLVADERLFREQFAIDVRTSCEAINISPKEKTVKLRNVATGELTTEPYDKLGLFPGARPIRPLMAGTDLPGVIQGGTVLEVKEMKEWLERNDPYACGMHPYTSYQTVVPRSAALWSVKIFCLRP